MGQRGHMPTSASRGGAERGCGNFLRHEIYTNSVSLIEAGMDMERRIMCVHILDVICSVSRSSKCTKIVSGWGFAPDPTAWELTALSQSQLGLRGLLLRPLLVRLGSEGDGRGKGEKRRGEVCKNYLCPRSSETLALLLSLAHTRRNIKYVEYKTKDTQTLTLIDSAQ